METFTINIGCFECLLNKRKRVNLIKTAVILAIPLENPGCEGVQDAQNGNGPSRIPSHAMWTAKSVTWDATSLIPIVNPGFTGHRATATEICRDSCKQTYLGRKP